MQWANHSDTKIGDRKVLYNSYTDKFVLIEATKEGVGFVEVKSGSYEQLREDEEIYESKKQNDADRKAYRTETGQNNNSWSDVDAGNRRTGKQYAEISKGKSGSNGTADTQTSDRGLTHKPEFVEGEFPATTDDRLDGGKKHSLKGTDINTKDRQQLLDTIEQLKHEFEVTKFAKADFKKLTKMTKDILKEYSSQADFGETFNDIDALYQYMANGEDGHPAVWEDVYNRAYEIAQGIVKEAIVVDDYMYQEYKSLRNYLRTTAMKFDSEYDSVPIAYDDFNSFRKSNFGRLKFSKNGLPIVD